MEVVKAKAKAGILASTGCSHGDGGSLDFLSLDFDHQVVVVPMITHGSRWAMGVRGCTTSE